MLNSRHLEELLKSSIAPEIISSNVYSGDGTMGGGSPLNLFVPNTDKYFQKNGSPRAETARKYNHLDKGGWGVLDINGNLNCFKPDSPRAQIKSIFIDGIKKKKQSFYISDLLVSELKQAYPNQETITIKSTDTKLNTVYQDELFKRFKAIHKGFFNRIEFRIKLVKYEHAPDTKTPIFKLNLVGNVGHIVNRLVAKFNPLFESEFLDSKLNFNDWLKSKNIDFWQWLINHPEIPIVITEGFKKCASLLSNGYIAIGISGVWNGQITIRDEVTGEVIKRYLRPEIEELATKGREFILCFDNEVKKSTIIKVNQALTVMGKLLHQKGCQVSVMTWFYPEKGIDDVIFTHGKSVLDEIYNNRKSFNQWYNENQLSLDKFNPVTVNQEKLCDKIIKDGKEQLINKNFGINSDSQIIGLRSPKGTGKTEFLANIAKEAGRNGQPVLVITHRIQLGRALCNRFGVDYVSDWHKSETSILGLGLCIDSLHPNSKARFNPKAWHGAVVFLDEIEQVLWHVLNSNTCKNERVEILKNLRELLQLVIETGGKIYLSDADLSSISIDYIKQISGYNKQPFIINNTYQKSEKRKLFVFNENSPAGIYKEIKNQLRQGKKLMIHLSGQKPHSKWGTQVIERALEKEINEILVNFPDKKILRIDAETVANPDSPAYGIMEHLNETLPLYDVVIASPTIETGVSIDVKHFDSVFCIAWGIQSVDSVCQTLERVRDNIPRYLWCNKKGLPSLKVGNGSTNIKAVLASTHKDFRDNITRLTQLGVDDFITNDNDDYSLSKELIAYAGRAVIINQGYYDYREEIYNKLGSEGYQIESFSALSNKESKEINQELKAEKIEHYQQYCDDVVNSNLLDEKEAEEIEKASARTDKQNKELRKYKLNKSYGVEITPALVEHDDKGLYSKLQLHYYLTKGKEHLPKRDKGRLDSLSFEGVAFKPDANKSLLNLKIAVYEALGVLKFLEKDRLDNNDPELIAWHKQALRLKKEIKRLLGFELDKYPIKALNQFCDRIGYLWQFEKAVNVIIDEKKVKVKTFVLFDKLSPAVDRGVVFDYWLSMAVTPDCINNRSDQKSGVTQSGVTQSGVTQSGVTTSQMAEINDLTDSLIIISQSEIADREIMLDAIAPTAPDLLPTAIALLPVEIKDQILPLAVAMEIVKEASLIDELKSKLEAGADHLSNYLSLIRSALKNKFYDFWEKLDPLLIEKINPALDF